MIAPLPRRLITLALAALPWLPAAHAQAPEVAGAASASVQRLTIPRDTLWNIAATLVPGREPSRPQVMVAILRANPDAFLHGNMHRLRQGVSLLIPPLQAMQAEPAAKAAALVDAHLASAGTLLPVSPLEPLPGAAVVVAKPAVPAAPIVPAVPVQPIQPVQPIERPASAAASVPADMPAIAPAIAPAASAVPRTPPAPLPASAPQPTQASSPTTASAPLPMAAADEPLQTRWLPYAMLVMLVGTAVVLWVRRRPVKKEDALPSSFVDEQGVQRRRRPKVLDVSQAAADMARVVETLQPAVRLVSGGAAASAPVNQADPRQQAALKLDLARACMEVGRKESARALLLAVSQEGSLDQQADAAELMARLA
jgi:FimV-like protein